MQLMCAISEQEVFDRLKYRIEVSEYGTMYYNGAGQLHREVGPAVEWASGTKMWYQNGIRHRTDGPAIVTPGGYSTWYQNGKCHRTDGPAVEYATGHKRWFINGVEMPEAEFNQEVKRNA